MQILRTLTSLSIISLLLVGCMKNDSSTPSSEQCVISLGARVSHKVQIESRAAVSAGVKFTAAVAGWESAAANADYTSAKAWLSTTAITASEDSGTITLNPVRYYNQDAKVKTYIKAWYPVGTLSDDGKVSFEETPDGTVDVMQTGEVVGSAIDAAGKNLTFTHPLSQLKFKVMGDASFAGVKLVSIKVKNAQLPTGLDLSADAVVYGATTNVAIPDIAATQSIPTTAALVGSPVMIKPFASNVFKIEVATSDATYKDVTVTIDKDSAFVPGKAYTITLSFAGTELGVSAGVTPWDDSGTGNGTLL